ncbi:hypothetical protein EJD97_005518 [Solanum chilense]|uniref:Agenet domain-containing protein n=1 Tax=Solanum chilense TaxID=4083 RepID=A0A6N2ALE3_SOLCI|nr:hypothetical protein EJD97_005518 [Solanum chilense]
MAPIEVTEINSEEHHTMLSEYIKSIAFEITKVFQKRDEVEVASQNLLTVDDTGRDGQCSSDPPCSLSVSGFRLYDMVDVFANDGWWFGFISGKIGEEYYVYFPTTADNIAYHVLRFHQEWSNGKWMFLPRR